MSERKFRITVEQIGEVEPENDLPEQLKASGGGIECDGFVIIGDRDDGSKLCLHRVTDIDIALAMAHSGKLMGCAHIAKALKEAKKIEVENMDLREAMKDLAEIMLKKE